MTWMWLVLVVIVLGATTAVAAGRGDRMRTVHPDRPDVRVPATGMLRAQDLAETRFSVVPRGYRMDEVDDVIARLTREIAVRDAELARLTDGGPDADVPGRGEPGSGEPGRSDPEPTDPERDEDVGASRHAGDHPGRGDRGEEGPDRTGGRR